MFLHAGRLSVVLAFAAGLLTLSVTGPVEAQVTIHHPEDGFATIQEAVEAAGCAGTVRLAAGVYNERVLVSCGVRLIGAGVDRTIIDATDTAAPGFPLIGLGNPPFAVFPFTGPYQVAHLTLRAGPNAPVTAVALGWVEGAELHHLRIVGFFLAIGGQLALDVSVHHTLLEGPGADVAFSAGVRLEQRSFREHLPGGRMSGHSLRHNLVHGFDFGLDVWNTAGAHVSHNVVLGAPLGIQLLGTERMDVSHNLLLDGGSFAGVNLVNAHESDVHHNVFCGTDVGVRYETSILPDAFGLGPASDNTVRHNLFVETEQTVLFEALDITGHREFKNLVAGRRCPVP